MERPLHRGIADSELASQLKSPTVAGLMSAYFDKRNAGAYSDKAKVQNLKRYSEIFNYLESKNIVSVADLEQYVSEISGRMFALNDSTRQKSARIKELQSLIRLSADYQKLKPVVDAIPKDFEKKRKAYTVEHESEINQFYAVKRKLDAALTEKSSLRRHGRRRLTVWSRSTRWRAPKQRNCTVR